MNLSLLITNILTTFGFGGSGQRPEGDGDIDIQPFSQQLSLRPFGQMSPSVSSNYAVPIKNSLTCGLSVDHFSKPKILNNNDEFNNINTINAISTKIVGGHSTASGEFPWQVSLQKIGNFGTSHFCGGSLISSKWIITAAHCVEWTSSWKYSFNRRVLIRVVMGVKDLSSRGIINSIVRNVQRTIIHPAYNSRRGTNDIALLELESEVDFALSKGMINSVCLPGKGQTFTGIATTAGWGKISERGPHSFNMLAVDVPIVSEDRCRRAYKREYRPDVMMCAGDTGKDSCQGDSGGALVHRDTSGRATIIGIVSVGNGCGRRGYPGIYTRVSSFSDWIMKYIN